MITRITKQKKLLNEAIESLKNFFTAEDILKKVEKDQIGMATIYRFLKEKRKNGELFAYTCDNRLTYSAEKKSHCHYICEETGEIIHFDVDSLDFLKDKIPGDIKSFHIEVRGTCKKCK